jgi:hypothetical protein
MFAPAEAGYKVKLYKKLKNQSYELNDFSRFKYRRFNSIT